eukprot:symbB.v1.2.012452.t2/scaffold860.1/size157271/21
MFSATCYFRAGPMLMHMAFIGFAIWSLFRNTVLKHLLLKVEIWPERMSRFQKCLLGLEKHKRKAFFDEDEEGFWLDTCNLSKQEKDYLFIAMCDTLHRYMDTEQRIHPGDMAAAVKEALVRCRTARRKRAVRLEQLDREHREQKSMGRNGCLSRIIRWQRILSVSLYGADRQSELQEQETSCWRPSKAGQALCRVALTQYIVLCATGSQRSRHWPQVRSKGLKASKEQTKPMQKKHLLLETDFGNIRLLLHPEAAPMTVEHVCCLVDAGLYDGCYFYRSDFVLQWGLWLPNETEVENPYPDIAENETNVKTFISNRPGTVAIAHGIGVNGNSDIFINLEDNDYLDTMSLGFCVLRIFLLAWDEKWTDDDESVVCPRRPPESRLRWTLNLHFSMSTRQYFRLENQALHMEMERTHEFLPEEFFDALIPVWQEITEGQGPHLSPRECHYWPETTARPRRVRLQGVEDEEDGDEEEGRTLHGSSLRLEALLGREQPPADREASGPLESFLLRAHSGCRIDLPTLITAHDELLSENLELRKQNEALQTQVASVRRSPKKLPQSLASAASPASPWREESTIGPNAEREFSESEEIAEEDVIPTAPSSWRDAEPGSPSIVNAAAAAFAAVRSTSSHTNSPTRHVQSAGSELADLSQDVVQPSPNQLFPSRPSSRAPSQRSSPNRKTQGRLLLPIPSAAERARPWNRGNSPSKSPGSASPWRNAMRPVRNKEWSDAGGNPMPQHVPFEFSGAVRPTDPGAWPQVE